MEQFIVSARKYRPQNFSTVVGQSHITTTLKNAIRNQQLAHAFLFCGPRGVGKTTCARILAKTINCENRAEDGEACNNCHSCLSFNEGSSMNIHELDAASNNSVDDIRQLVEQVRFAPQSGKFKVYIVDEVHMLSTSAFNAFLKTLEEPPPYAIFILATTEKHKILPTILSRCQIFDFKRITTQDTVEHLEEICQKESIDAEKAALQVIAQKSEGCMRDALSMLDKIVSFTNGILTYKNTLEHLNILDEDYYFGLMDYMLNQDLAGAMLLYDDINRKGFEGDLVLNGFAEFIRNLLLSKDEKVASLIEVVEGFRSKYLSMAARLDTGYLVSALNVLAEAEINFKSARNKKLHVELALIKLCYLRQAIELSDEVAAKKTISQKPINFRSIPDYRLAPAKATPAKPVIATPSAPLSETAPEKNRETGAVLIIEEKIALQKEKQVSAKISSLQKIREKFSSASQHAVTQTVPLTEEALQEAWTGFTDFLRENKNPAVQSFMLSELKVDSDNSFTVITTNSLQQKFIESEKLNFMDSFQQKFTNPYLVCQITLEQREGLQVKIETPLNSRERLADICSRYPLVKDLKDRLRLELDY